MVQDCWPINASTILDNMPLPLIWTIVEDLEGMDLFSTFNNRSRYNNILVRPEDQYHAAFKTTEGQSKPVVMPFRLMNTPGTFQRMINHYMCLLQIKYRTKRFKVYLDCYGLFRSIILSLLIQTYPQCIFNYLQVICTTSLFTSHVYSHTHTCKCLLDLSTI